jgi:cobalt/nickel transport protein
MSTVRRGTWIVIGVGLITSLVLAGVISFYASGDPDGLEKVAEDVGFLDTAQDSAAAGSPLADYATTGVGDGRLSVGIAGVVGVLLTAAAAFGLFLWLGRRNRRAAGSAATEGAGTA